MDDKGNPYYVATTYKPKFMLSSNDPTGAILLNAVTGETKRYDLKDIPDWVDRVFSADNVISRVDDYYTYQKGFWNTVFSQTGVKKQRIVTTISQLVQIFTSTQVSHRLLLILQTLALFWLICVLVK